MRDKATIIGAAVAVLFAGLSYVYMRQFERRVSGGQAIPVLVAKRDIPLGEPIDKESIGVATIPEEYKSPRQIASTEINKLIGVRTRTAIKATEFLLWTDLATTSLENRDLSSLISPGMRAISIGTSGSAFGGMLRPGDRVDVLLTTKIRSAEEVEDRTMVLLQKLLVIGVGANAGAGSGGREETGVTFTATPAQAQLLTFARRLGSLSLTLRNDDDIEDMESPETMAKDIIGKLNSDSQVPSGPAPPPPSP